MSSTEKLTTFIWKFIIPPKNTIRTTQNKKGSDYMHFGSKGWYVNELKKLGIRTYEGRKLESYRTHILAALLEKVKKQSA